MDGRRLRRFGRRRRRQSSLLPVGATAPEYNTAYTVSCCYCDFKIRALNDALSRFGRRHAAWLRVWFSIGVGFSLTLLLALSFLLVWNLFAQRNSNDAAFFFLFGFSPSYLCMNLAMLQLLPGESSEGVQVEYIAVFFAVLFPGALVAFNQDLLQSLPRFTVLRVYCAGIWHNAACCAVCGMLLFLMPLILFPFYKQCEGTMVLDVPSTSPLSGYLSPGDVIVSLDGIHIHNEQDWMEMAALLDKYTPQNSSHSKYPGLRAADGRKGYCVSNYMIEESKKIQLLDNQSACPNDFIAFVTVQCFDISISVNVSSEGDQLNKLENVYCLNANDIVKLKKCGDGWVTSSTNGSHCVCSKEESCLTPVQLPGLAWVEITYSRPYSLECKQLSRSSVSDTRTTDFTDPHCGGTFVFFGDVIFMAQSVSLTQYQPRWASSFGAYLPNILRKSLICLFHVSLTLALLNSLPAYFLDGESIFEVTLCFITSLSPRQREKVLHVCLMGGTLISILTFLMTFFINFFVGKGSSVLSLSL
ncbi:membrane-bound transcription factor site-2 protease homolog isoform X3 [Citrus sinensis]|uniref:membrane-bound transcription factor site-2 protease homolog isoform X3 n=1 Tax=Citrus sinensis TaxID=2711 RepID=UPI0022799459|nr:membrane-bound transcription factor site-2 protease homolog isoform X3 [Citrus sinensis]